MTALLLVLAGVCGAAGLVWRKGGAPASTSQDSAVLPREARKPTADEIRRAAESTPITIFMTHTCPVCRRARAFMADNGFSYREKDVDDDDGLRRELISVNPEHTVPTFDVDGTILVGFAPRDVVGAIAASVERRYGYKVETAFQTK